MLWLLLVILGSVGCAVTNIIDKVLLDKYIPNPFVYVGIGGFFKLVFAVIILTFFPPASWLSAAAIIARVSGLSYTLEYLSYAKAIIVDEVSRIIPIMFTYPVFITLLAFSFLGEQMTLLQSLGILITTLGAILISFKKNIKLKLSPGVPLILICSILIAVASVMQKYSLNVLSPLNVVGLYYLGMSLTSIPLLSSPKNRRQLTSIVSEWRVLALVSIEQVLTLLFLIAVITAISFTNVSFVGAVESSQAMFVFILTVLFSLFFPRILKEQITRKILATKLISTLLIILGIYLITTS